MLSYAYHTGFKSREAAEDRLVDYFADGAISEGEKPDVESYRVIRDGKRVTRWMITLQH